MVYRGYRRFSLNTIWVLIAVNVILFIATTINRDLIFLLGLNPASFPARPWTIVSNLFVHSGLWHVVVNMLALYFFGTYLSRLVGERKFLLVYFGGGLLGNIAYILLASPLSIAIGASGAIFALGGALAVMVPRLRVFLFPIPVPIPLWIAVIGGFFVLLILLPFVAWQAHLGGLVLGLITGYFFRRKKRYFF
jgi:membrane associated rhomboid family serine protease